MVFSLGNRDERVLLRHRFHEQVTERPAARPPGPDGPLRAGLVAGQPFGLGAALSPHPEGEDSRATPEQLADLYAPALQAPVTGDAGISPDQGPEAAPGRDQDGYGS